jgi:hypothetical protein
VGRLVAIALIIVIVALCVVYVPVFYSWLRTGTWLGRKDKADALRDKAIHELEEALENDKLVHFLSDEERQEIEQSLNKYRKEQ